MFFYLALRKSAPFYPKTRPFFVLHRAREFLQDNLRKYAAKVRKGARLTTQNFCRIRADLAHILRCPIRVKCTGETDCFDEDLAVNMRS